MPRADSERRTAAVAIQARAEFNAQVLMAAHLDCPAVVLGLGSGNRGELAWVSELYSNRDPHQARLSRPACLSQGRP